MKTIEITFPLLFKTIVNFFLKNIIIVAIFIESLYLIGLLFLVPEKYGIITIVLILNILIILYVTNKK